MIHFLVSNTWWNVKAFTMNWSPLRVKRSRAKVKMWAATRGIKWKRNWLEWLRLKSFDHAIDELQRCYDVRRSFQSSRSHRRNEWCRSGSRCHRRKREAVLLLNADVSQSWQIECASMAPSSTRCNRFVTLRRCQPGKRDPPFLILPLFSPSLASSASPWSFPKSLVHWPKQIYRNRKIKFERLPIRSFSSGRLVHCFKWSLRWLWPKREKNWHDACEHCRSERCYDKRLAGSIRSQPSSWLTRDNLQRHLQINSSLLSTERTNRTFRSVLHW